MYIDNFIKLNLFIGEIDSAHKMIGQPITNP